MPGQPSGTVNNHRDDEHRTPAQRQMGSGIRRLLLFLSISVAFITLSIHPGSTQSEAPMQTCPDNIRIIRSAAEQYFNRHTELHDICLDPGVLTREGDLRVLPVCPAGGFYIICIGQRSGQTHDPGAVSVACSDCKPK